MATSYLSPGVYLEETDTGNKPIEGVSTSTAGVVGVTERGPANVPILVTSVGEFRRTFGGYLSIKDFTANNRAHCYLPHAVEGMFTNGGKLCYVVRVTADEATRANRRLFFDDPQAASPAPTVLLRAAEEGTGTGTNLPPIYVLDKEDLAAGQEVRIGDGSRAEYRTISAIDPRTDVSLNLPLQAAHAAGAVIASVAPTIVNSFKLSGATGAGATQFTVSGLAADINALIGASKPALLEVNTQPLTAWKAEHVMVTAATAIPNSTTTALVTIAQPLQLNHADQEAVSLLTVIVNTSGPLAVPANAGDSVVYVDDYGGFFTDPKTELVLIDPGANQEVRRLGQLFLLTPALPPYEDYPSGTFVEKVALADDTRTVTGGNGAAPVLNDVTGLVPGMLMVFNNGQSVITAVDTNTKTITLQVPLAAAPTTVVAIQPRTLTAPAGIGAQTLQLSARIGLGLDPEKPDVLRIGTAPKHEYVTVVKLSEPRAAAPDAGAVVIDRPLQRSYGFGAEVALESAAKVDGTAQATFTLLDAPLGTPELLVADAFQNYHAGDTIRVTLPNGDAHYHVLDDAAVANPIGVELDVALSRSHTAGESLAVREPLFEVRALDTGAWGNRVMITAADEEVGLAARAEMTAATVSPGPGLPSTMKLNTVTGIEAGTVLEMRSNDDTQSFGDFVKVKAIDRTSNNLVILDAPGLSLAQVSAFNSAPANAKPFVRSREFRMEVMLLKPPNPALPIRNDELLDRELFRTLSMDPRHSHYFMRILGATWDDGSSVDDLGQALRRSDHRSEGGSQYVRVKDLGTNDADKERVRLGPEDLIDILPSGLTRAARLKLGDGDNLAVFGDDQVPLMGDAMYIGQDDIEPAARTGIYALKNQLDISLVACPGQVTPQVQQALIDQCEDLRYRFAVLDAQGPADDTIDDITAQRQQFDTKYAAFYHPWLTISDPFPTNLAAIAQFPIPPSGHMLGIYARVDDQRGVHKAPANEVVGGMTGLTRYLNQQEQDVLNAYPINIDVIRDFRVNNRGIRVWGARVITSDSDWKYVNVRRLLIFIEDSLDRGLQWVVFEPNDEALWARVRRSISNFLTTVWRNGALEGTTKDQAFYVKCDRTTMTQDDIDNGRLIAVVGVAPVKPAEFVIIRIGLWTADASS